MKTKRYLVKDELGENYEVTELGETVDEEEAPVPVELTEDEKAALKKLAAVADELIALIPTDTVAEEAEEVEEEPLEDEIEETEEKEEEVIDTCKSKDSKKSIGSIEKKRHAEDSVDDSIESAWAKRYGGNK